MLLAGAFSLDAPAAQPGRKGWGGPDDIFTKQQKPDQIMFPATSSDEVAWTKDRDFVLTRNTEEARKNEDVSCPNFFKLGDRWMLLCIGARSCQ